MKPRYSPVPCRAVMDKRLTAQDLRLLAAVAAHDCFGAYGKGCTAGHERLARIINAAQKSVARSFKKLLQLHYISSERTPEDRRRRTYRIIYTNEDHRMFALGENADVSFLNARTQSREPEPENLWAEDMASYLSDSVTETPGSVTKATQIGNRANSVSHCNPWNTYTLIEESKYKSGNRTHTIESVECGSAENLSGIGMNSSRLSENSKTPLPITEPDDLSTICKAWADFRGYPPILALSDQASLCRSIKRNSVERLLEIITRARASPFLRGELGDWNGMPIKWLWNETRLAEIAGGEHDGKTGRKTYKHPAGTVDDIRELLDQAQDYDDARRKSDRGGSKE